VQICLVGLSHKTAPVEVREKVALEPPAYGVALAGLVQAGALAECVVLSTCNRTELYALSSFEAEGIAALEGALRSRAAAAGVQVERHLYRLLGLEAVRHLFRVAASLDSLVVGEPQVLGQVKEAYRIAAEESAARIVLGRLFQQALGAGKRVRAETEIGALPVSVSSVAVELSEKIFGSLADRSALVLGAGDTARQTLRHLQSAGVARITIANRSLESARELSRTFSARAVDLTALGAALADADIVIASATSPEPILRRSDFEAALKARRGRPMFVIDIAVPRNVEPSAGQVYNLFLYDIDDLQRVVDANAGRRAQAAARAEAVVDEEVGRFAEWWQGLDAVPTLVALRRRFETLRDEEFERFAGRLSHLSAHDRELVRQFGAGLVRKLLHEPSVQIRRSGDVGRSATLAASLRTLFRLEEPQGESAESAEGETPRATPPPEPESESSRGGP
jgi:glutamyl-tRNA reductase